MLARSEKILLIALGNEFRSDDGIGPSVLHQLEQQDPEAFEYISHRGDPADLLELWAGRDVVVIDAAQMDSRKPGDLVTFYPLTDQLPGGEAATSSHAMSLKEAIELGKILDKIPQSLKIIAMVGENFCQGNQLSDVVSQAIDNAVVMVFKAYQNLKEERPMHEMSIMNGLMNKIDTLAREHNADRVRRVRVTLGALSHFSKEHFKEHFDVASQGGIAEGAHLDIVLSKNTEDPHAQDILLEEIEVDDD